jgi:phosphatidylglycerophosphate synthase
LVVAGLAQLQTPEGQADQIQFSLLPLLLVEVVEVVTVLMVLLAVLAAAVDTTKMVAQETRQHNRHPKATMVEMVLTLEVNQEQVVAVALVR